MAFTVTDTTEQLLNATNISTNIILEIDGITEKFGSQHILVESFYSMTLLITLMTLVCFLMIALKMTILETTYL